MKVTLKDVAEKAGVSIATVSHVINKTRYVSPELVEKIQQVIESTGYSQKVAEKECHLRTGRKSIIALVIPGLEDTMYAQVAPAVSSAIEKEGFYLSVLLTRDDRVSEKHILNEMMLDKRIAGIILSPAGQNGADYSRLFSSGLPVLLLGRGLRDSGADCVRYDSHGAVAAGVTHLLKSGHENIVLLLNENDPLTAEECVAGYKKALADNRIKFRDHLVVPLDLYRREECEQTIRNICLNNTASAFLATENRITLCLLRILRGLKLEVPKDVSVVGCGDESWCELIDPPLTLLRQSSEKMGRLAAQLLMERIRKNNLPVREEKLPADLIIRKSTQMVGRGPFGEKAVSPEELTLTEEEIERLRRGKYRVGISFHYSGTAWTRLHENAIRDTLGKIGVAVVAVTDAHFDPELQMTQLDSLKMQKPDAVIAIPVDDMVTAEKFKEISKETKLVFISAVPAGLKKDDYASCVSVDERENGQNAGVLLGEYFRGKGTQANVAFLDHGAPFYGTHLRDMVAEQVIREEYPEANVVATDFFYQIDRAYEVSRRMILAHPEINGLYVSWERPALQVIRALKELHREDIAVVTCDLDLEIAKYLARNEMVVGLSTQRPYEQGVAVALATAKALLGDTEYKYIGVPARMVQPENLIQSWNEIIHEPVPEEMERELKHNLRK